MREPTMMNGNCGIYRFLNTATGKAYVGQSVDLERRRKEHLRELTNGTHVNLEFQSEYNQYGGSCLEYKILEYSDSQIGLTEREKFWIDYYSSASEVYNIARPARPRIRSGRDRRRLFAEKRRKIIEGIFAPKPAVTKTKRKRKRGATVTIREYEQKALDMVSVARPNLSKDATKISEIMFQYYTDRQEGRNGKSAMLEQIMEIVKSGDTDSAKAILDELSAIRTMLESVMANEGETPP